MFKAWEMFLLHIPINVSGIAAALLFILLLIGSLWAEPHHMSSAAFRARTACKGPKETQDPRATRAMG